jgi:hypothetical protein
VNRGNGVCYDTVTTAVTDAWVEMGLQSASAQSRLKGTGRRKTQPTGDSVMAETCSDVKCVCDDVNIHIFVLGRGNAEMICSGIQVLNLNRSWKFGCF